MMCYVQTRRFISPKRAGNCNSNSPGTRRYSRQRKSRRCCALQGFEMFRKRRYPPLYRTFRRNAVLVMSWMRFAKIASASAKTTAIQVHRTRYSKIDGNNLDNVSFDSKRRRHDKIHCLRSVSIIFLNSNYFVNQVSFLAFVFC